MNPELKYKQRQDELSAWGFGNCGCERCFKEAKTVVAEEAQVAGMDDLERAEGWLWGYVMLTQFNSCFIT